jgi:hypothetical protein
VVTVADSDSDSASDSNSVIKGESGRMTRGERQVRLEGGVSNVSRNPRAVRSQPEPANTDAEDREASGLCLPMTRGMTKAALAGSAIAQHLSLERAAPTSAQEESLYPVPLVQMTHFCGVLFCSVRPC